MQPLSRMEQNVLIDVQQHTWDVRSGLTLLWTVLEVVCFHEACGVDAQVARMYNLCCQSGAVLQEVLFSLQPGSHRRDRCWHA